MNFPIPFSSPAEAVKAIFDDMIPSNPTAIIAVQIKTNSQEYTEQIAHRKKDVVAFTSGVKMWLMGDEWLFSGYSEYIETVESISITSIQSVELKFKIGDRVLVISNKQIGTISKEVSYSDYEVTSFIGHKVIFPGHDLMKVPLSIDKDQGQEN